MAEQDELGRRAVFVELRDEGFEHFGVGEAGVGLGAVGVVAPVLVGAEEEDLDAELAGFVRDGEDVGFLDAARGDIALALDEGERGEAIAQQGGALEVERLGGLRSCRTADGPARTCERPERNWRASSTSSP